MHTHTHNYNYLCIANISLWYVRISLATQVRLSTILGSAPSTAFTIVLKSWEDSEGMEKTINKPLSKEKG